MAELLVDEAETPLDLPLTALELADFAVTDFAEPAEFFADFATDFIEAEPDLPFPDDNFDFVSGDFLVAFGEDLPRIRRCTLAISRISSSFFSPCQPETP